FATSPIFVVQANQSKPLKARGPYRNRSGRGVQALRDLLDPGTFKSSQDDPRLEPLSVLVGAAIRSTPQLSPYIVGRRKYFHRTCHGPFPPAFARWDYMRLFEGQHTSVPITVWRYLSHPCP